MTPEVAALQQQMQALAKQFGELQTVVYRHQHTGADRTQKLGAPSSGKRFVGYSSSAGGGSPFPSGWSCARIALGHYVVTHNLGLAADSYLVLTASNQPGFTIGVPNRAANSFDVIVSTSSPSMAANSDFMFELIIP